MTEQIADANTKLLSAEYVPRIQDPDWIDKLSCGPEAGEALMPFKHAGGPNYEEKETISKYCASCLVREECLVDALRDNFRMGIRGGMTENQRKKVHDEYEKNGGFQNAETWKNIVDTAIITKNSFTHIQQRSLARKRDNQTKLVETLAGLPEGRLDAQSSKELATKLAEVSGIHYSKVTGYLRALEDAGRIEKLFQPLSGRNGNRRLIGVQIVNEAA